MIREVPRYTQIDQMFQDTYYLPTHGSPCSPCPHMDLGVKKCLSLDLSLVCLFAYLLTKRIESITLRYLHGQVGRIDSVGIVLSLRSWL
jgi:hypothetical protein